MKTLISVTIDRHASEFYLDGNVARWASNNAVPPADCLAAMAKQNLLTAEQHAASVAKRDEETAAFIAEYRRTARAPSAEQRADMRAAFGAGATVVNVITGRKIRL
jgi:hypothetical protein